MPGAVGTSCSQRQAGAKGSNKAGAVPSPRCGAASLDQDQSHRQQAGSGTRAGITQQGCSDCRNQAELRLELQSCWNRGRHSSGVEQVGSNVKAIPKGKERQVLAFGILLSSPYQ